MSGESHGQRSLAGYSPWGRKELDMTKQRILPVFTFIILLIKYKYKLKGNKNMKRVLAAQQEKIFTNKNISVIVIWIYFKVRNWDSQTNYSDWIL